MDDKTVQRLQQTCVLAWEQEHALLLDESVNGCFPCLTTIATGITLYCQLATSCAPRLQRADICSA
jgi:hypothetical protein